MHSSAHNTSAMCFWNFNSNGTPHSLHSITNLLLSLLLKKEKLISQLKKISENTFICLLWSASSLSAHYGIRLYTSNENGTGVALPPIICLEQSKEKLTMLYIPEFTLLNLTPSRENPSFFFFFLKPKYFEHLPGFPGLSSLTRLSDGQHHHTQGGRLLPQPSFCLHAGGGELCVFVGPNLQVVCFHPYFPIMYSAQDLRFSNSNHCSSGVYWRYNASFCVCSRYSMGGGVQMSRNEALLNINSGHSWGSWILLQYPQDHQAKNKGNIYTLTFWFCWMDLGISRAKPSFHLLWSRLSLLAHQGLYWPFYGPKWFLLLLHDAMLKAILCLYGPSRHSIGSRLNLLGHLDAPYAYWQLSYVLKKCNMCNKQFIDDVYDILMSLKSLFILVHFYLFTLDTIFQTYLFLSDDIKKHISYMNFAPHWPLSTSKHMTNKKKNSFSVFCFQKKTALRPILMFVFFFAADRGSGWPGFDYIALEIHKH
ncbi:hypothetical protein VP01_1443g1 [Puccinia sorghi]|uniref:Uncharacterized protein n=1 Tax=Puccinia sorghi TaxID=27349 RepID=A0A0L6VK66_9BASI|nr:hypothetical protein VP01_1443g1 [Puccinia sorghi]